MQTLMNHTSLMKQAVVRLFITALTAALLATLASCGNPHPSDPGLEVLSSKIDALNESITGSLKQADDVAFWQIATATLVVLSGFALIFGAALGSHARREAGGHSHPTQDTKPNQP